MIWALLLLAIVLLMFLLVPVWYRRPQDVNDQSEENLRLYEERSREVAASDLDDPRKQALQLELDREFLAAAATAEQGLSSVDVRKRWPLALALLVVSLLATLALYQQWGAGDQLRATELLQKAAEAQLSQNEETELLALLDASAQRYPDNAEWSYLLGRMSLNKGDYERADEVFSALLLTLPEEAVADRASLLSLLAQARFFGGGQQVDAGIYKLMQDSLALQPNQP